MASKDDSKQSKTGDREEDIMKKDVDDTRKVFNDPIHGHIDLHPLCVKIIDTPEFQRLRDLKQLSNCYFVYPGASHNRFEHSIGVCYLAGQLVRALKRNQPTLNITEEDVLCVEIAGLCHDLGHGPFSHLFDQIFIPKAIDKKVKWQHEDASKDMFDYMLEKNDLKKLFLKYGLFEKDIEFIKELVTGPPKGRTPKETETQRSVILSDKERSKEKSFLYEIVANTRNSIDVDKWDYFARDCHMLGIKNNFDHNRCIQFARVIEVNGEKQICFRDKEANNLFDMFYTRQTLHRRAYQHRVTSIINIMVADAMVLANDHILFVGKDGEKKRMSEAIYDMEAYCKMTDNVFFQILYSTEPYKDLVKARKILEDVLHRRLYKYVAETRLKPEKKAEKKDMDLEKVKQEIFDKIKEINKKSSIEKEDLTLHISKYDYGMKEWNPIDSVRFYSKDKPDQAKKMKKYEMSSLIPRNFLEQNLLFFCKKRDDEIQETLREAFDGWCMENGYASNIKFLKIDLDKDGKINPQELLLHAKEHEKDIRLHFKKVDINKDGLIDVTKIQQTFKELGLKIGEGKAKDLLQRMDKDGIMEMDFDDWNNLRDVLQVWRHSGSIDIGDNGIVPDDFSEEEMRKGIWWRHLVSGGAAAAVSRTCTAPLDRLKILFQVHGSKIEKKNNLSIVSGFRHMLSEGGVLSLWRGNGINVLKIAPESAIKFWAYEQAKRIFRGNNRQEVSMVERFASGSLAGAFSQTVIYPMEVMKTRLALAKTGQYKGMVDCVMKIYQNEGGLKTFYRGYVPNIIGIIPYAGIDLCVYETLKNLYMARYKDTDPSVFVTLACGTTSSTLGQLASYPLALIRTKLQAERGPDKNTMKSMFFKIIKEDGMKGLYRGIAPNFLKVAPAVSISYVVYEKVKVHLGIKPS